MSDKIEFKNGSYIIGVDLANDSKIARGERSKIVWVGSKYLKQENRKFRRNYMNELKLKWHQKFRIEIEFIWDDIKEWACWIIIKMNVRKGE